MLKFEVIVVSNKSIPMVTVYEKAVSFVQPRYIVLGKEFSTHSENDILRYLGKDPLIFSVEVHRITL